jgi:hypothetical protein
VLVWILIAFLPVVESDFVNWDDLRMFLDNAGHRGSWATRLWAAWTSHRLGEYMPVTWMSYALDRSLWADDPSGYHLSSLLLHAAAAIGVLALARRLLRHALGADAEGGRAGLWGGATVAALAFAVHPLRVEPVAWVSARGTLLGGLLLVLSLLVYVLGWERGRATDRIPARWLLGSLGLFAASLLARATGLVLPAVLVVLDIYPLRRLGGGPGHWSGPAARAVWVEKLGFGLLALLAVPMGYLARGEEVGDFWRFGHEPGLGLAWGVYSAAFYPWKTLIPAGLGPVYPMPEAGDMMLGTVFLSLCALVGITAGLIVLARRWPGPLAAWVVYLVVIAPLSGVLPFGRLRGVSDRYSYVACIGWAIVAGGAATLLWRELRDGRMGRLRASAIGAAILAVLVGWSALSWQQTKIWRDSLTLWVWALGIAGDSPVVHNNLGWAWAHAGEFARAEAHSRRAVDAWPTNPTVLQTLARILAAQGRLEESAETLRRAVAVAPGWPDGRTDLGSVLYESGATDGAMEQLRRAIELEPGEARAHELLGRALAGEGRTREAELHFRLAAELNGGPWPSPGAPGARPGAYGVPVPPAPAPGGLRPRRRGGRAPGAWRGRSRARNGVRGSEEAARA